MITDSQINERNKRLLAGTEFESILRKYEEVPPNANQGKETSETVTANETIGTNETSRAPRTNEPNESPTPQAAGYQTETNNTTCNISSHAPRGGEFQVKKPEKVFIKQEPTTQLTNEERSFLNDVYNHEFESLVNRFRNLGLSAGSGSRLVAKLVSLNLIRKLEINLGGRGNSITLLELTGEAYLLLKLEPKKYGRGSGMEHYFWQVKVKDTLKPLGSAEIEENVKNKFIDVTLRLPDGSLLIGIEIEISSAKEHIVEQIKRDIEAGIDFLIIGFKDKRLFEQMQKTISASNKLIPDKVRLCLLPEIVKEAMKLANKK
ncbi:MAG: hypothetical protein WC614_10885 [bacterium]